MATKPMRKERSQPTKKPKQAVKIIGLKPNADQNPNSFMTNKTSAFGGTISDQPNPQSFGHNVGTPSSNDKSSFRQAVEHRQKELDREHDSFFNKVIDEEE